MNVYVLTEGPVVEGLTNIGIYSTLDKAKSRVSKRQRSISFPNDVEWFIEMHEIDSDRNIPVRTYRQLKDRTWSTV